MKRIITLMSVFSIVGLSAQTTVDFETFTLTTNSYYKDTNSVDFQTTNAVFEYEWTKGSFPYWSGGFSYTNVNDTSNGTYTNLYGCIAYKGYNNSNNYVTGQANGIIKLKAPHNFVNGFYMTNTTYAAKVVKNGDGTFAKKFGGPTGNDPDWFKVTVKGFLAGSMKPDSAEFYLADYRFSNNTQDYIVDTWQWVNCSALGVVDSIQFFMSSSDAGSFGMNTPAFFSLDNFTTSQGVGVNEVSFVEQANLYPNPAGETATLKFTSKTAFSGSLKIFNPLGKTEYEMPVEFSAGASKIDLNLSALSSGVYFVELRNTNEKQTYKLVKQ